MSSEQQGVTRAIECLRAQLQEYLEEIEMSESYFSRLYCFDTDVVSRFIESGKISSSKAAMIEYGLSEEHRARDSAGKLVGPRNLRTKEEWASILRPSPRSLTGAQSARIS